MEHVRIYDNDNFDLGDDSGSDGDGTSSDDDIDVILHGTPEQKRKLHERIHKSSESDEFEQEMESELEQRLKSLHRPHLMESNTVPDAPQTVNKKMVTIEDPYAGDGDSDDDALAIGPKLSNDDLFYDPDMDDEDQKWVDSQRTRFQSSTGGSKGKKKSAAPNSDAVLDCPACLTTLCIDCQRHTVYQHQYRAMFVMNCTVDRGQVHSYPMQSRKRGKNAGRGAMKQGRLNDAPGNGRGDRDPLDNHPSGGTQGVGSVNVEGGATVSIVGEIAVSEGDTRGDNSFKAHETSDSDSFYNVTCTECSTGVAVLDQDEVYHFHNVIAAYT